MRPAQPPIGIVVAQVAKAMSRAFDDALAAAGGSLPTWLVLLGVKTGAGANQSALAERVGVTGPTLTHHLDRMERDGFLVRTRDPGNRRVRTVTLTEAGDELFAQLREAAVAFDARARTGLSETDTERLRMALATLEANVRGA